jgi:hypothetical protein
MPDTGTVVDGFRFMPPSLKAWMTKDIPAEEYSGDIPWVPLKKPLKETTFTLMTSAGISSKTDPPFDVEREKREPAWGDPSSRQIPNTATEADIEYPYGRTIGQAGDREGQRNVLIEALNVLDKAQSPGQVFHLPFTWQQDPKDTNWHPPEISPIVKLFLDEIKKAGSKARK